MEVWDGKKTGGRFLKSNPMSSGDVDKDVSAGGSVFGAVVKKCYVFLL